MGGFVFLSYDREDLSRARRVSQALEEAGLSVWWDRHIKSGAQYNREIDEALRRADAVVVLWSHKSIDSAWVRDEAAAGRDSGKLVPVRIDDVDPPLGFRQYQTTDLTRWRRRRTPQFDEMLEAIASLGGMAQIPSSAALPSKKKSLNLSRPVALALALLGMVAASLLAWQLTSRSTSVPVVAVTSADPSPASLALARDLLVKLGRLQTAQTNQMDLVNDESNKRPLLSIEVARSGGGTADANLALMDVQDRSLLWAKDFSDPHGNEADLRQQLAYAAAQVLDCALDGLHPTSGRLTREALKTYLKTCAANPELAVAEVAALIPPLQQLVREAPHFHGGWGKLLLAELRVSSDPLRVEGRALEPALRDHIIRARNIHPDLPEAYFAEYWLTPDQHFLKRSQLLKEGIERNPHSAILRSTRSHFLMTVGRMGDAVLDAQRAMDLDPLSPQERNNYIVALAFAGRIDEALVELDKAERLWPGATTVRGARYLVNLRVGDPKDALRLLRSGVLRDEGRTSSIRAQELFLTARIERSPENVEKAVQGQMALYHRTPKAFGGLAQVLVEFDREEELFRILLNRQRAPLAIGASDVLFRPGFAEFQADPRFMQIANRFGLLSYWRASGEWPDFCARTDLPYDCKEEATKLAR